MLVLRFKPNAGDKSVLCIGDPAGPQPPMTVTVLSIRGELVELAVDAPPGVAVTPKSPVPSRRKPRQENNPVSQNNPVPLDSACLPML